MSFIVLKNSCKAGDGKEEDQGWTEEIKGIKV